MYLMSKFHAGTLHGAKSDYVLLLSTSKSDGCWFKHWSTCMS